MRIAKQYSVLTKDLKILKLNYSTSNDGDEVFWIKDSLTGSVTKFTEKDFLAMAKEGSLNIASDYWLAIIDKYYLSAKDNRNGSRTLLECLKENCSDKTLALLSVLITSLPKVGRENTVRLTQAMIDLSSRSYWVRGINSLNRVLLRKGIDVSELEKEISFTSFCFPNLVLIEPSITNPSGYRISTLDSTTLMNVFNSRYKKIEYLSPKSELSFKDRLIKALIALTGLRRA